MGADELGHTGDGLPRVSVVIPTHNRKRLLASTLHCVLGQRDVHFEVLVVDDGSSDGTALMVEVMADERLRVLRNDPARGVSGAGNRAVDRVLRRRRPVVPRQAGSTAVGRRGGQP